MALKTNSTGRSWEDPGMQEARRKEPVWPGVVLKKWGFGDSKRWQKT